jgi:hypothetical protein
MDMMQQSDRLVMQLSALGGDKYILSGCVDDGAGNVSDGTVVISGETLTFAGGVKKAKVTIVQTTKTLSAFGEDYPEAYVYRVAQFADAGDLDWADFTRLVTNKELAQRISDVTEPIGTIKIWAGHAGAVNSGAISDNYMLCDGRLLSIAEYPALYGHLGDQYSYYTDDRTVSFRIPNLIAKTVVGTDAGETWWSPQGNYRLQGFDAVEASEAGGGGRVMGFMAMPYIIKAK